MKPVLAGILLTVLLAGCLPDDYKMSVDSQVRDMVRDREQAALGYTPEVQAQTTVKPTPPKKAFDRIPTTAVPPPIVPPMQPAEVVVPYGQLGPGLREQVTTQPAFDAGIYSVEAAMRGAAQRLQLGPPPLLDPPMRFDLFKSVEFGVQNSRDYQNQMESLYIAAINVTLQRHLFEPIPSASINEEYDGAGQDVRYTSVQRASESLGITQQLPYGGSVFAKQMVNFVDVISGPAAEGEQASVVLGGSIPLLRGAGMINLEPLIQSERTLVYQVRNFETYRRQFAVNIATQYFTLLNLQEAVINRRLNYQNLSDLTQRTQALYDAGRLNFLEVQRALQAQLFAESDLVNAQEQYQGGLDTFKLFMGMHIDQVLDVVAIELDVQMPDLDEEQAKQKGLRFRLDLKTAEDQVDDARRGVDVAKNGLLPDLKFYGQGTLANRPYTASTALDNRNSSYDAGFTLNLPLDRVAERNAYRVALITLEQSQRSYATARDQVVVDVRNALRSIRTARVALEIQRVNTDLAQRRLEYANELLKAGSGESRDVVEAQSSLLSAQDSFNAARAKLQTAVLQFLLSTGELRIDPSEGALGRALDRAVTAAKDRDELSSYQMSPGRTVVNPGK